MSSKSCPSNLSAWRDMVQRFGIADNHLTLSQIDDDFADRLQPPPNPESRSHPFRNNSNSSPSSHNPNPNPNPNPILYHSERRYKINPKNNQRVPRKQKIKLSGSNIKLDDTLFLRVLRKDDIIDYDEVHGSIHRSGYASPEAWENFSRTRDSKAKNKHDFDFTDTESISQDLSNLVLQTPQRQSSELSAPNAPKDPKKGDLRYEYDVSELTSYAEQMSKKDIADSEISRINKTSMLNIPLYASLSIPKPRKNIQDEPLVEPAKQTDKEEEPNDEEEESRETLSFDHSHYQESPTPAGRTSGSGLNLYKTKLCKTEWKTKLFKNNPLKNNIFKPLFKTNLLNDPLDDPLDDPFADQRREQAQMKNEPIIAQFACDICTALGIFLGQEINTSDIREDYRMVPEQKSFVFGPFKKGVGMTWGFICRVDAVAMSAATERFVILEDTESGRATSGVATSGLTTSGLPAGSLGFTTSGLRNQGLRNVGHSIMPGPTTSRPSNLGSTIPSPTISDPTISHPTIPRPRPFCFPATFPLLTAEFKYDSNPSNVEHQENAEMAAQIYDLWHTGSPSHYESKKNEYSPNDPRARFSQLMFYQHGHLQGFLLAKYTLQYVEYILDGGNEVFFERNEARYATIEEEEEDKMLIVQRVGIFDIFEEAELVNRLVMEVMVMDWVRNGGLMGG